MTEQTNSCLVLCIDECDNNNDINSIDTRLFVTYDYENDNYVVYGKRDDTNSIKHQPYFFRCNSTNDLYNFMSFVIDVENRCNITLYNYNNMPIDCEAVDYEFMQNNRDRAYELAGYDSITLERKSMKKSLRILRNMYNYY